LNESHCIKETVVAGETISKEKLSSVEIKSYISRKERLFKSSLKELNVTLIDDNKTWERYIVQSKSLAKKSTVQETYDCGSKEINSKCSYEKFSRNDFRHLTKLIITQTIKQVMFCQNKILELTEAFMGYKEETVLR
jgi:hypothetical protein